MNAVIRKFEGEVVSSERWVIFSHIIHSRAYLLHVYVNAQKLRYAQMSTLLPYALS